VQSEQHLLWIARQALKAPCPAPWRPCLTEDSEVFYFNFKTGESVWDHPVDVHSKKLYLDQKAKSQAGGAAVPSLCLALPHEADGEWSRGSASPRKRTARSTSKEETSISGVSAKLSFGLCANAAAAVDGSPDGSGEDPLEGSMSEAQARMRKTLMEAHDVQPQQVPRTKVTVMEEELDPDYEPSQAEIEEYAAWLGMDVEAEQHLFWIARAGLKEKCPEPWKPCRLADNELFYFNFTTGESIWDHPCDRIFQAMYKEHKGG